MALLFILLLLLYQIGCDKIEDEILTEGERYLHQSQKSCIFCISSFICFENEVIHVRNTILDSANGLKIIIFPSSVIFLILHNF